MSQVQINHWLIVSKALTPDKCIRQGFAVQIPEVGSVNMTQPVQVFSVVKVADFGFIHIKGRNGYTARAVVPFEHNILFRASHGKGTTLNENKAWPCLLFIARVILKSTKSGIIIIPACGV